MLTLREIIGILKDNYSAEEIIEIVEPDVNMLVDGLEEAIQINYDRIMERLEEDGYYEDIQ